MVSFFCWMVTLLITELMATSQKVVKPLCPSLMFPFHSKFCVMSTSRRRYWCFKTRTQKLICWPITYVQYILGQFSRLRSPFEWELVSRNLVAMASMGLGFFIITLLCEFKFFIKPRRLALNPYMAPPDEDQDVANERKRVLRGSGRRDLLKLENLTKVG